MKLLFCEIENFGKLHRERIDLTGEIIEMNKPNGWGKTTFSTFLKSMFYGMKDNRSKAIESNDRKKYLPWQGGTFGGAVEFLYQGKAYRVERSFGKTPAQDTFAVFDMQTKMKTSAFGDGSDFGERIFGLDKESFCRTAYIPQDGGDFDELTGNIQSGLMRVFNAQGEKRSKENGLELALQRLEEAEKTLRKRRPAKGKLDEIDEKLTAITRAKGELFTAREDVDEARARVKAADEDFAVLQGEITECDREIGAASASANGAQNVWVEDPLYENYRREKSAAETRVNKLRAFFPQDPSFLNLRGLEEKTSQYFSLQAERKGLETLKSEGQNPQKSKKPILSIICFVLCAVLLAVAGSFLALKNLIIGGACGAVGIVLLVIGAAGWKGKNSVRQSPAPDLLQKIAGVDEQLAILNRELAKEFSRFALDGTADFSTALEIIKTKADEYFYELQTLERLRSMAIEKTAEIPKMPTDAAVQIKNLTEKRKGLEAEQAQLLGEKSKAAAMLEDRERRVEELLLIVGEERGLLDEKERLEKKLLALQTAKEYLTAAHENLASRYLSPVGEGLRKYLAFFDGELAVDLSANGEARVEDSGFTRETGHYSRGYRDVFGLCLRLAVIDALYENELPFLLLDDPFVNLDEQKTVAAKRLIKDLSKRYQILYFTCKTPL